MQKRFQESAKSEKIQFFTRNCILTKMLKFSRKCEISIFLHFTGQLLQNLHIPCKFQWFLEVKSAEIAKSAKFSLFRENRTFPRKSESPPEQNSYINDAKSFIYVLGLSSPYIIVSKCQCKSKLKFHHVVHNAGEV